MKKSTLVPFVGGLVAATLVAPYAHASPYCTQVKTVSGKVECILGSTDVHCYAPGGFANSPSGTSDYLAAVTSAGAFSFVQAGGLGNCDGSNVTVLDYGSDHSFNGWSVHADGDGTTFTNQVSGHGMFVSVQSAHGA